MTVAEILMLALASGAGLIGLSRLNATGVALAVQYFAVRGYFWASGAEVPLRWQFLADLTVLAVIYCKRPARDCFPYRGLAHQLCALWIERSLWDRIVIACFLGMWAAYSLPLSPYHLWWSLFWLASAQYAAAGIEGLDAYLTARTAKAGKSPDPSAGSSELRWIEGLAGHA
jgi:hypothetical protein